MAILMGGNTRASAEVVLVDLKRRYGSEGLTALQQAKRAPQCAGSWQLATASHIREDVGSDFWLDAALLLWEGEPN